MNSSSKHLPGRWEIWQFSMSAVTEERTENQISNSETYKTLDNRVFLAQICQRMLNFPRRFTASDGSI